MIFHNMKIAQFIQPSLTDRHSDVSLDNTEFLSIGNFLSSKFGPTSIHILNFTPIVSGDYLGKSVEIHIAATKVMAFPSPSIPTSRGRHKTLSFLPIISWKMAIHFFSRFSSNKAYDIFYFLFLHSYRFMGSCKEIYRSLMHPHSTSSNADIFQSIVQYQRQEINIGVIHRT